MKLENETEWDTRSIVDFVKRGLRAKGADVTRMRVRIYTTKRGRDVGGYAYFNSHTFRIGLPKVAHAVDGRMPPDLIRRFAQVLEHEVDHTFGLRHGQMMDSRDLEVPWSEGLIVVVGKVKSVAKAKPSLRERRAANAKRQLEKWERKLAQAEKRAAAWRKKVRYYERTTKEER